MKKLWEEFCVDVKTTLPGAPPGSEKMLVPLCGLCANTGYIEHDAVSPAGTRIHLDPRPCICPNGRAVKKLRPKEPRVPQTKSGLTRFWMSWEERSKDYRPLKSPPNKAVLGWWCSGYAGDGSHSMLVAWVEAKNERDAKKAIAQDWPGKRTWRFIETREPDWRPSDRFPLADWTKERVGG